MTTSEDIRTQRLLITPFQEKHLTSRYVGWLNDPGLMRYSEQRHKTHTLESCREYSQSFRNSPHFFWAIEEIEEGLGHIGNINAYIDENNSIADIGILIGEKGLQKKGYGFEAWMGVCNYFLLRPEIRKLTAGTLARNIPMLEIMRRSGMVEDGTRKRHFLCDCDEVDIVYMALFKNQWEKR